MRILSVWKSSSPPVAAQIIHYVNRWCSSKCRHYQAWETSWHRSDCVGSTRACSSGERSNDQSSYLGSYCFVDYASRWVKVHLMQDTTGESTLEAKNAFEQDCITRNVVPNHYHVDNRRFAENYFKEDCVQKMQNLTFCGVGAHDQNGVSEKLSRI